MANLGDCAEQSLFHLMDFEFASETLFYKVLYPLFGMKTVDFMYFIMTNKLM